MAKKTKTKSEAQMRWEVVEGGVKLVARLADQLVISEETQDFIQQLLLIDYFGLEDVLNDKGVK